MTESVVMSIPDDREGAIYWRALPDGYEITVYPMTFGKARVCYGLQHDRCIIDAYCYPTRAQALDAAAVWTGEGDPPDGWHRHPNSGRRRDDGDATREYVMP
jgi:hypothetical protein